MIVAAPMLGVLAVRLRKWLSKYLWTLDMAERLTAVVFPNLQFEKPADNKGLSMLLMWYDQALTRVGEE